MSRPMALGLVLLVLFLTSQSEWRPPQSAADERGGGEGSSGKSKKLEVHKEGVKEKIIIDLTAHNKRLEGQLLQVRQLATELAERLDECNCPFAMPLALADANASRTGVEASTAHAKQGRRQVDEGVNDGTGVDQVSNEMLADERSPVSGQDSLTGEGVEDGQKTALAGERTWTWGSLVQSKMHTLNGNRIGGKREHPSAGRSRGEGLSSGHVVGSQIGQGRDSIKD